MLLRSIVGVVAALMAVAAGLYLRTRYVGFEPIPAAIFFVVVCVLGFVILYALRTQPRPAITIALLAGVACLLTVEVYPLIQEKKIIAQYGMNCDRTQPQIAREGFFWMHSIACGEDGRWVGAE